MGLWTYQRIITDNPQKRQPIKKEAIPPSILDTMNIKLNHVSCNIFNNNIANKSEMKSNDIKNKNQSVFDSIKVF